MIRSAFARHEDSSPNPCRAVKKNFGSRWRLSPGNRQPVGDPLTARRPTRSRLVHIDEDDTWNAFVERYERFCEVLCCAAKEGASDSHESEYLRLRCWFMENYYRHAPRLREYLEESEIPFAAAGVVIHDNTNGVRHHVDGFEALFLARTLREVLTRDHGNLIRHISVVSTAVFECCSP